MARESPSWLLEGWRLPPDTVSVTALPYTPTGRPPGLADIVSVAGEVWALSTADSQETPDATERLSPAGVVAMVQVSLAGAAPPGVNVKVSSGGEQTTDTEIGLTFRDPGADTERAFPSESAPNELPTLIDAVVTPGANVTETVAITPSEMMLLLIPTATQV